MQEFLKLSVGSKHSFFQTQTVWEYFSNYFLPIWCRRNPDRVLRIWSVGTATGEETYSIAMMCEEFRVQNPDFAYQITSTELSSELLNTARRGHYNAHAVDHLNKVYPELFQKYFTILDGKVSVKPFLKTKVRFELHHPLNAFGNENDFDIVFLRDVLTCFLNFEKEKILQNVSSALSNYGILVIGESESLAFLNTDFKLQVPLIYENNKDSSNAKADQDIKEPVKV